MFSHLEHSSDTTFGTKTHPRAPDGKNLVSRRFRRPNLTRIFCGIPLALMNLYVPGNITRGECMTDSKRTLSFMSLLLLAFTLMACAPQQFSPADNSSAVGVNGTATGESGNSDTDGGSGSVPVTGTTDPANPSNPNNPADPNNPNNPTMPQVYPEITYLIPTNCVANSTCVIKPTMNRSDAKSVSFQWATDDVAYTSNPATIAEPNVHYVPTRGMVVFNPTEIQKTMPIQTLNRFTTIWIPFKWWDCRYDGKPLNCSVLKFNIVRQ